MSFSIQSVGLYKIELMVIMLVTKVTCPCCSRSLSCVARGAAGLGAGAACLGRGPADVGPPGAADAGAVARTPTIQYYYLFALLHHLQVQL